LITISFEDEPLHDTCIELEKAELAFGSLNAAALVTFISEASAFENVADLIAFLGDEIKISANDSLCVSIGSDYCATLVVAAKRFERDADGRVIWSSVTRLKLVTMSRVP